jgi:acetylornithine deacetylase/succinyl-diaminopimelate desuccinylase-like protein
VKGLGKAPPLCLMSHVDVVPAEPASWPADTGPLSGAVKDGYLWGRGAVDMKGMGAIEVLTLAWLKRTQLPLDRDVVLLAVADEEVSDLGALSLTDPERWKSIGCAEMINEGGLGAKDALFEGQAVHAISTAEKGVLWVRMTAEGRPGHGSTPRGDEEAPVRLLEAMDAMGSDGGKFVLVPQMRELLADIGRNKGGFTGLVLRTPPLRRLLAWGALKKNPTTRAAMHDTIHLTGMEGANEPNVVPGKVSALYDCRLLPGTTPEAMLAELQDRVKKVPGISFEVLHQGLSNESPTDDPLYRAIARYAVEDRPYAVAGPLLSVGYTDSLLLRPLGVNAYGYLPFELPPDVADTMHSNDERIPVDQVGEGLRRLFSIVVEVAGSP